MSDKPFSEMNFLEKLCHITILQIRGTEMNAEEQAFYDETEEEMPGFWDN